MENQTNNASQVPPVPPAPAPVPGPHKETLMAALAYIGPLVIVSYLTKKDDPFVKFHIKQGAVLFVIEIALWVIGSMIWMLWPLLQIVHFATVILSIIGIINAVKGNEKALPIVGKFSDQVKI